MADKKRLIAYDPITFESFIRHATKHIEPYYDPYGGGFTDAVDSIEGWLNNNTVDAVEVVHGRWEHIQTGRMLHVRCTACGVDAIKINTDRFTEVTVAWNCCPNCGAKMDVEKE